jgi:hypothetical protein
MLSTKANIFFIVLSFLGQWVWFFGQMSKYACDTGAPRHRLPLRNIVRLPPWVKKILKLKLPPAATTTDCDRWDRSNSSKKIPAVPPGLAHILKTRPLVAYIHTPAFGNGEPLLRLAYSAFAFPLALRSPFGIAMLCRDFTARGSLKEQNQSLLTLPQRFCAL